MVPCPVMIPIQDVQLLTMWTWCLSEYRRPLVTWRHAAINERKKWEHVQHTPSRWCSAVGPVREGWAVSSSAPRKICKPRRPGGQWAGRGWWHSLGGWVEATDWLAVTTATAEVPLCVCVCLRVHSWGLWTFLPLFRDFCFVFCFFSGGLYCVLLNSKVLGSFLFSCLMLKWLWNMWE